jgi:hypothetical protein
MAASLTRAAWTFPAVSTVAAAAAVIHSERRALGLAYYTLMAGVVDAAVVGRQVFFVGVPVDDGSELARLNGSGL